MRHVEGRKEENGWNGFCRSCLTRREELDSSFLSNDVQNSSTFMKWCTKVKPHKWRCDVKLVRHVEGRKEEHDEMGFAGAAWPKVMYKSLAT